MLTRWFDQDLFDPFGDFTSLRDAMNRLFEQAVVRPRAMLGLASGTQYVPLNLFEKDGEYVVQAYLPGVSLDNIEVTAKQSTLTIRAQIPEPVHDTGDKQVTWLLKEVGGGEVTRTLTLPKAINGDQIRARYDQGVLTIEVPVAAHEMPKKIAIEAGEPQRQLIGAGSR